MPSVLQDALKLESEALGPSDPPAPGRERRTWAVAAVTAVGAALEVSGGVTFHSSGLLGEGLHACGHVGAMVLAGGAYLVAREHETHGRKASATRVRDGAGLINAALLICLAVLLAYESWRQIALHAHAAFWPALALAAFGLVVNVVCIVLLHPHSGKGADLNFKAIYWHILGDAGVAVLAMAGLTLGRIAGWSWPDGLAGGMGAVLLATLGAGIGLRCLRSLTGHIKR
jgi:cation diffusion facilitator family transporter